MERKTIIAIGAHFDDVEINCGGTLALARSLGYTILIIVLGNGVYKDRNNNIARNAYIAKTECLKSLKKLDLNTKNLIVFNYKETSIPFNEKIIKKLDKILLKYENPLILTHSVYDSHQDHYNTARNVLAAARYNYKIFAWESIFPSRIISNQLSQPNLYIDISKFQNQKINAINCYNSQIKKFNNYKVDWLDSIISRSRYRGIEVGCKYAEAFYTLKYKIDL